MDEERAAELPFPQASEAIELRHLRAFVAVAEELSFSRAADRLYISQPALSRQIRALERLVACKLVSRSTRHVELTLAGEALLDRARTLLREVDEAVLMTQAVGGELVGRVARLWEPVFAGLAGDGDLEDMRAAFEALHAQFALPPEIDLQPARAGGVPALRVSPPSRQPPTLLYLHGGGYVLGSAFGYRHLVGALAAAADATALIPDYRLAPEHPFPAALDDALAAYGWLLDGGTPPGEVTVAGDSSGAGLVLSLLLALRQRGLPLPRNALLLCPLVDLSWALHNPSIEPEAAAAAAEQLSNRFTAPYLGGHPLGDPLVSPLSADLAGLPRLLIQAGTGDPLRTHAQRLAEHAQSCGVDAHLELYPTSTHAFQLFWSFLPEAADALQRAGRFVARAASAQRDQAAPPAARSRSS